MGLLGLDLKRAASICDPASNSLAGGIDELGKFVIAQHLPLTTFRRCALVWSTQGQDRLLSAALSLHGLRAPDLSGELMQHRGVLVRANLTQSLIGIVRRLYADEPFGVDLKDTV